MRGPRADAQRRVRLALVAIFILAWTLSPRHLLAGFLPWPISVLGASWTAVPLLVLWVALARAGSGEERSRCGAG